jgi:glutaredoxin|tara:strand:+ start:297 stop:566 length:270 start_codon:yes stop_codon:yes gene_type:complete
MLTIYSKNNCGYCVQAKSLLKNNDIPFEEINIEEDADQMQFILSEGHRTMPQIYKDGKLFVEGGFQGLQGLGIDGIKDRLIEVSSLGDI